MSERKDDFRKAFLTPILECPRCSAILDRASHGTWVEVFTENRTAEIFFEVLQASFYGCGLRQSATFTIEKDTVDFH